MSAAPPPDSQPATTGCTVAVELRDLPVALHLRSRQHSEELQREFALIYHGRGAVDSDVPARLMTLIERLRSQFAGFAADALRVIETAAEEERTQVDVTFTVPSAAGQAATMLSAMLDEADEFCQRGDLLTLASDDEVVAYRRWFLDEFAHQTRGRAPQAWRPTGS